MSPTTVTPSALSAPAPRVDWVDFAKGICIVLVVMMHSTLGVEAAMGVTGKLNTFIEWARPFRMPDFFLISGLFLGRRIDAPWRSFLDKKVIHFLYFYLLWMAIQFLFKGYGIWEEGGTAGVVQAFFLAFIEPFGTLWFIYLLPVFFLVTRLKRNVPPLFVFAVAAALEILPIHTGWILVDEFAARYVYFFTGYWLSKTVFRFAGDMQSMSTPGLISALFIWSVAHTQVFNAGWAATPGVSLVLGFLGTGAVITMAILLSRLPFGAIFRFLGENSIVVYLAFFIFMATARTLALRLAPGLGPDIISLGVTLAGVTGPVVLFLLTRKTKASFLFKRPAWAKLPSEANTNQIAKMSAAVGAAES